MARLGTCLKMCPEKEEEMRILEKMVHKFEVKSKTNYLIKQFSRSAAGNSNSCKLSDLRPPHICRQTVNCLIREVFLKETDEKAVYAFVFDRLRALRQDMVVQESRNLYHCHVLEVCVRFHLVSSYRFLSRPGDVDLSVFEPRLNFSHLLECLKMSLSMHEGLGSFEKDPPDLTAMELMATYLMLNLGSSHSILWCLDMPDHVRKETAVDLALKINLCYLRKNYAKVFKLVRKLPLLAVLAFHWKLPVVLLEVFEVMSVAHNSKNCRYPVQHLAMILGLNEVTILDVCSALNVSVVNDSVICFSKANINLQGKVGWPRFDLIDDKMKDVDLENFFLRRNDDL